MQSNGETLEVRITITVVKAICKTMVGKENTSKHVLIYVKVLFLKTFFFSYES